MANQSAPSRMAKRRQRPTKPKKKRNRFLSVLKWLVILFLAAVAAGVGLFAYYAKDAPTLTKADLIDGSSAILYAADNKEFATLGTKNTVYVSANNIPTQLKQAVVSIEDRRFYQEKFGIDPIRIGGAALNNVVGKLTGNGSGLEGGSTLTQQLVKLSVFSTKASDQTFRRKAQEAWLAMQVERTYSKEQILEFYINKVYMDNGQYGMATGAKYYYGKDLKQLTLAQTALIAGMPQSPVGYDPYEHPEAAKTRRDAVLAAMLRDKKITKAQAAAATATPITDGLVKQTAAKNETETDKVIDSYLTEVIAEVKKKMNANPYTDGLKIYTNLNMKAQKRLYEIVNSDDYVTFPDNKMQVAVTMTDPNTGNVIAQIGGRKTGDVRLGFNRATRNTRSNGSTMKPLMAYGPAIEYLNYSTYQQLDDSKYIYPGTSTQLYDWDRTYLGMMSMRAALVQSRNVPAVRTLEEVGMSKAVNFLKGLGIDLPKDEQYGSSAIGASVTTEEEAAAYGAFANGGTYYEPTYIRKVVKPDGTTVDFTANGNRAMKSSTAYMITDMLKGVFSGSGTATSAAISGLYQAGKTGTTDYSEAELAANPALNQTGIAKDAWFTGYTRQRVISVWTGYDKATEAGLNYSQQTISQQIYKALMTYDIEAQNLKNEDWTKPDSVLVEHILRGSNPGTAVTGNTANTTRELYVRGYGPTTQTTVKTEKESSSSSSASSSSSEKSSSSSSSEKPDETSDSETEDSSSSSSSGTDNETAPGTDEGGGTETESSSSSTSSSSSSGNNEGQNTDEGTPPGD
ncbi:PBP1A family penicillin-binding protein [Lacticaseibacillus yichunensis]|uniref:PBP1A family penicillin-binding protein n=1 Tax=Lacticaseibacillus yichunensis TaxID=2486015 RepID=UPI000F796914|nr:PBP1A family penicillin-binding protein [Lacticaseibacillus yichunensis]